METTIKCEHCGYQWKTNSSMILVTCPSCQKKTKRKCPHCGETETIYHADVDTYQCKVCAQRI